MTAREVLQRLITAGDTLSLQLHEDDGTDEAVNKSYEAEEQFMAADAAARAYLAQPEAEAARSTARKLVDEQAEDDGLWFEAETAPEAYLQAALRKLHAAVEGSPSPAQPEPQDEARDAARYRWLRAEIHSVGRADIYILRNDGDWSDASQMNSAYDLDDVVDAALAAQEKESAR